MELDGLLTSSADGVFAVNPEGKIVLWNRAAEKTLGYSAKEVLGRPCRDV
ncbi:MAG: PAS domain-containing protein, partial [candidate division NC10 bacterium]|nr:PAS domain-containing protein [candidate division NC10 bacterium]